MPGNNARLDYAAAKGYIGLEMDADTQAVLRPLIMLQVWLFTSKRDSEWTLEMAPRIAAVNPEGLYIQGPWLLPDEPSAIVIRNRICMPEGSWDIYDCVRLVETPMEAMSVEEVEDKYRKLWHRHLAWAADNGFKDMQRALDASVKKSPPPAVEKPWWEQDE